MNPIATPESLRDAAKYLASADNTLAPIIAIAGLPAIIPNRNYYQKLVESIISQQLSVKAAATILKRFLELFPGENFPTPGQILEKDIEELRSVGLSRQKATYIQDLAIKVLEETVRFNHLDALSNEEVISELTKIKGVGIWTVHMFLIFCMGRLNVLPTGDLGIKNGIFSLYKLKEKPSPEEMEKIALVHKWHPYESIASWYIWHSLDNKPAI
jgi:DNA-3-methyladenine glycosylase II